VTQVKCSEKWRHLRKWNKVQHNSTCFCAIRKWNTVQRVAVKCTHVAVKCTHVAVKCTHVAVKCTRVAVKGTRVAVKCTCHCSETQQYISLASQFIDTIVWRDRICSETQWNTAKCLQHTLLLLQHIATHSTILRCDRVSSEMHLICVTFHSCNCCNTLQHTATNCNKLQHTATHCNTLQHTLLLCVTIALLVKCISFASLFIHIIVATHCNTLQHTAIHCNTLQHTVLLCVTIAFLVKCISFASPFIHRIVAAHCNTLQHTATNSTIIRYDRVSSDMHLTCVTFHSYDCCSTLQHTVLLCVTIALVIFIEKMSAAKERKIKKENSFQWHVTQI